MNQKIKSAAPFVFIFLFLGILVIPALKMPGVEDLLPAAGGVSGWIKNAVQFPEAYQKRFGDNFFQRGQMINWFNSFRLNVLHETVFTQVVVGKEGWLYYTGEQNLDSYQCSRPFTPEELNLAADNLLEIQQKLAERGIPFILAIAPNKESIYPEYLPKSVQKLGTTCPLDQLLETLESRGVHTVIDFRPVLLEAKKTRPVYFRTDTHWNLYGAYLANAEIVRAMQASFPELVIPTIEQYDLVPETTSGDLARLLAVSPLPEEQTIVLKPKFPLMAQSVSPDDDFTIYTEVPGSSLPRAAIFRDSFSNSLIPYLSEYFSRAVFQRSSTVDFDLIDREKPDVVILEMAERYVGKLSQK